MEPARAERHRREAREDERAARANQLLLLMPDHLHALIGVDGKTSLAQLIRGYKRITAKIAGIKWQRNFFDHRLRHDESFAEKFAYICQNPVRAGLISTEHDWPYAFIPDQRPPGRGDRPQSSD